MDLLVLVLFTNICITTFNSQIYDPNSKRYEVPIQTPTVSTQATELDYDVNVNTFPFGISVKRKSTNTVMWVKLFSNTLFWGHHYFFECGIYLKVGCDKELFNHCIIIFHIQLTETSPFDFDHLGTTVSIQEHHFSTNFFVPNALLIQGWHLISVVVFCYNSPHYLPKIKKNFQTAGCYWRRGVRVGGWCCTNLIFLAKIFPDTTVDKSCICPKSFSTRALMYM